MLARNYRFVIVNNTGVALNFNTEPANDTIIITTRPWKINSSNQLEYASSEITMQYSTSDLANGAFDAMMAQENDVNLYLGLHAIVELKTNKGTNGNLEVYLEVSTDGGVTFVSDSANFNPQDLGSPVTSIDSIGASTRARWFEL